MGNVFVNQQTTQAGYMKRKIPQGNVARFARALRRILRVLHAIERARENKQWEETEEAAGRGESWFGEAEARLDDALGVARGSARDILRLIARGVPLPAAINVKELENGCMSVRQDDAFDLPWVRKVIDHADLVLSDPERRGVAGGRPLLADSDRAGRVAQDAGVKKNEALSIELSDAQKADYAYDDYHCKVRILVTGTFDSAGRNMVVVNEGRVVLGHKQLQLLLVFVAGAKNNQGAWVDPDELIPLRFNPRAPGGGKYQPLSRLRDKLRPVLESDPKDLFEKGFDETGMSRYRLSTHPDFVTYDKGKLLQHPDPDIKRIAGQLP